MEQSYEEKKFIPLRGMPMKVTPEQYWGKLRIACSDFFNMQKHPNRYRNDSDAFVIFALDHAGDLIMLTNLLYFALRQTKASPSSEGRAPLSAMIKLLR